MVRGIAKTWHSKENQCKYVIIAFFLVLLTTGNLFTFNQSPAF